jgi:hypothetical protein
MSGGAYYVYTLKDPRSSPAKPFYVGKGVGTRAWDHLLIPDATKKGRRIAEIKEAGFDVLVTKACEDLTEIQALRLEAELIAAFGLEGAGGLLLNTVQPTGKRSQRKVTAVVPLGAAEKAQLGLQLLKDAVFEFTKANSGGVTNAEVCHALGLHCNYGGGTKDYLSWSVLGLLMEEGRVRRDNAVGRGKHVAQVR